MSLHALDAQPSLPRVIVAHPDPRYGIRTGRAFRELGWEVHAAQTAAEVRRLARRLAPTAIVLAAEWRDESGWLICDKLVRQQSDLRVFLVGASPTPENRQFAEFVGAAGLLDDEEDASQRVEEALGLESGAP